MRAESIVREWFKWLTKKVFWSNVKMVYMAMMIFLVLMKVMAIQFFRNFAAMIMQR